jgi:DNA-binding MarR family transcriptional regulator
MPLTEFESKVILALREKPLPIMSLPKSSGMSGSAVYNAVRELLKKGLVSEEREKDLPRRRFIRLTDGGRRVVGLLNQIEHEI